MSLLAQSPYRGYSPISMQYAISLRTLPVVNVISIVPQRELKANLPRVYTKQFGQKLLELWREEQASATPRLPMRQKLHLSGQESDREIFDSMQLGDPWGDAEMVEVWCYLYKNKHLLVPSSWQSTMAAFHEELRASVPRLQHNE